MKVKKTFTPEAKNIVIPLYDNFELLDVAGPVEVLGHMSPPPNIWLVANGKTVSANPGGIQMVPNTSFADCPQADILLVPGGSGQLQMMDDPQYISFLQKQAKGAEYVTSVCVGSLLLAVAGLLNGYIATTHWNSKSVLQLFPYVTVESGYPRYVICGNRVTSGGVSSGIDMALALVAIIEGDKAAELIQLLIEYQPDPPFNSGDPDSAGPRIMAQGAAKVDQLREKRFLGVKALIENKHE